MDIEKFETIEVNIYKQATELINRQKDLIKAKDVLHDNYDSKVVISASVYSSYNRNADGSAKENIPLDILFEKIPTKEDIEVKLDHEIKNIDAKLLELYNTLQKDNIYLNLRDLLDRDHINTKLLEIYTELKSIGR